MRIPFDELSSTLRRVLVKVGFAESRARFCAQLFAETTRDGVYSHGLNRFPQFVRMVKSGVVVPDAEPRLVAASGALERWDGNSGPGNLNAWHSMDRAIAISKQHAIGSVALANTNHWMRGGTYGWQAAEAGVIGICWTNTLANLPPWGASDPRVGNNPLVIAVPRTEGHVVLDAAMSQFSYGALASYRMRGEQLPVDGGFDSAGNLTREPAAIESSKRPLPIGYWKGSGLALLLDLIGAILSAGCATHQIHIEPERETKLSQVFIAINPAALPQNAVSSTIAGEIVANFQLPKPTDGARVRYPGERVLETRTENLSRGIPVDPQIWREVQSFL
ncbi:MAG TPA: 3-dehydro-L-gulonate 2-dehydrogenase [Candidatus Acidoferrum sp.]|nr:3-dehydro-L-gulonate 2-dehydrogenase [Candidatus Acidoferrum sp.]